MHVCCNAYLRHTACNIGNVIRATLLICICAAILADVAKRVAGDSGATAPNKLALQTKTLARAALCHMRYRDLNCFNGEAKQPTETDFELEIFADIVDIYPFGYPTEQFLTKLKNDVHDSFVELKE